MNWKWNTDSLTWNDKCSMCQEPLQAQGDGGVVLWTDSKQYHVSCLLDRLAAGSPHAQMETVDGVSHWGFVP